MWISHHHRNTDTNKKIQNIDWSRKEICTSSGLLSISQTVGLYFLPLFQRAGLKSKETNQFWVHRRLCFLLWYRNMYQCCLPIPYQSSKLCCVMLWMGSVSRWETGELCAVFLLCAVLLDYASCDPNMYCLLEKTKRWCQIAIQSASPPVMLTQSSVGRLYPDSTWKKKCCTVTVSSSSSSLQKPQQWERPLLLLFAFPTLYLELQPKPFVKCSSLVFMLSITQMI